MRRYALPHTKIITRIYSNLLFYLAQCNEVRKYQRECEKLKTELGHLDSKLKYHANKLQIEVEAKAVGLVGVSHINYLVMLSYLQNLERKLEEERNAPNKLEEKANGKKKNGIYSLCPLLTQLLQRN